MPVEPKRIKWVEYLIFPLAVAVITFGLSASYFSAQQEAADKATESRHAEQMRKKDEELAAAHVHNKRSVEAVDRQTAQKARDDSAALAQRHREAQAAKERDVAEFEAEAQASKQRIAAERERAAADRAAAAAAATAEERQQRERDWEDARSRLIVATRTLYAAERRLANPECEQKRETTTTYSGGQPQGSQTMFYDDCSAAENAAQRDVDTALAEFEARQSRAVRLAPESLKSPVLELSALFASTNPGCPHFQPLVRTPDQSQTPVRLCPRTSEEELRRAIAKLNAEHFW